jgi:hypothetical protein
MNQPLNIQNIESAIFSALESAESSIFHMTDEIGSEIHPEYLTTANICFKLAEKKGLFSIKKPIIKAEVQTRIIERQIQEFSKKRAIISRNGRVDIEVVDASSLFEKPRIIIEAKGFIKIKKDGGLYKASFDELKKDTDRNKEIIDACITYNAGPIFTASTFYVNDENSMTEGTARKEKAKIEKALQSIKPNNIKFNFGVKLKTMACSTLYPDSHIPEISVDGESPEEVSNPPKHIICGIIYMHS